MQATTTTQPKIVSIKIKFTIDDNPDTSWIGEYSDTPGPANRTIDREERGDALRNEYRYFIAALSGDDTGNPESVEQDYARLESINRGDICFYGIRAVAEVSRDMGNGTAKLSTFESPGLWGIESDSGDDYFAEVATDELSQLRDELEAFNVDLSAWDELSTDAIENIDPSKADCR